MATTICVNLPASYERCDNLPKGVVGHAKDRYFSHTGMLQDHILNHERRNLVTRALNDIDTKNMKRECKRLMRILAANSELSTVEHLLVVRSDEQLNGLSHLVLPIIR